MRYLRKNTAVIVTVGPFYDKTDGVTLETALTITNEKITLTADTDDGSAPTNILDNVTGATSGTANDLNYITGNDAGLMQMEFAAADVNRLGRMMLTITDAANHVPVFHEFMVVNATLYDAFFATTGGAIPNVAAAAVGGLLTAPTTANVGLSDLSRILGTALTETAGQTAAAFKQFFDVASPSGTMKAITAVVTVTGNVAGSVASVTAGVTLAASAVQAIWDAATSALTTVGSIGKRIADFLTGDAYVRLGAPAGASMAADIAAAKADTAAVKTQTDKFVFTVANKVDANVLAIAGSTAAATNLMKSALGLVPSTCAAGSTTTNIVTNLTETTNDHYNGGAVIFTTGALAGQRTFPISAYNGTTKSFTVPALTEAPADTDAFVIC